MQVPPKPGSFAGGWYKLSFAAVTSTTITGLDALLCVLKSAVLNSALGAGKGRLACTPASVWVSSTPVLVPRKA